MTTETTSIQNLATTEHELKVWPDFYPDIESGLKPFDWRNNDRNFQEGDLLRLREWCPNKQEYSGRECRKLVTYVLYGGHFDIPYEKCILGLKPVDQNDENAALVAQIQQLFTEVAELSRIRTEKEVEEMMRLKSLEIRDGHFDAVLQSNFIEPIAAAMARFFEIQGGENFLLWQCRFQGQKDAFDLILKPRDSKSPENLAIERKARIAELEARLAAFVEEIRLIPVEEKLPPLDHVVLVSRAEWKEALPMLRSQEEEDVWLWVICSNQNGYDPGDYWDGDEPTHWQEIPKAHRS